MDSIGGIIWIVLIIAFSIFRKAQKNAKNQQNAANNSAAKPKNPTLQSQLTNALKQINDIKTSTTNSVSNAQQQNTPRSVPQQRQPYKSSLEGYKMEGHQVEGYQMEGHQVEGHKVEGHKVEGVAQKHRTGKFNKDRIAVTESSMQSGFAGEGCDEHYDYEISYSPRKTKARKERLYFSDNPIVQGVVMAQVLERPKRR